MKTCLKCGYRDNALWRHSRFDYGADYMRFEDAQATADDEHENFVMITDVLEKAKNNEPVLFDDYYYYRRGKGGIWLYRVHKEDYKMPRERKKHNTVPVKEVKE